MKTHLTFAQKLGLTISSLLLISATFIGYPLLNRQLALLDSQFQTTGATLTEQLAANAIELVFVKDELKLDNLVLTTTELAPVVAAVIVNRDNDIISSSGLQLPERIIDQQWAQANSGVYVDAFDMAWFHHPIDFQGVIGGMAWVALDKKELINNQRVIMVSALSFIALFLLSTFLLAVKVSRALSRPIEDLATATEALSEGDYSVRLNNTYSGEFKQLTDAFNIMATGLQQKLCLERNFSRFVSPAVAKHYQAQETDDLLMHSQRVEASILFVDLVNYTKFSQQNSPEVVAGLLNIYFSIFSEICHLHSGNVDKFIGDCAMLVFGCPVIDANHRQHALECAISIRDSVEALNQYRSNQNLPHLGIRVGIASGSVLAGLLGSPERLNYSVVGEAANLAARLCDKAPAGQILTDQSFVEALPTQLTLTTQPTQTLKVKGFATPIKTVIIDNLMGCRVTEP